MAKRSRSSRSVASSQAAPAPAAVAPAPAPTARLARLAGAGAGGLALLALLGFLVKTVASGPPGPAATPPATRNAAAPAGPTASRPVFDRARAFADLEKQVRFGPRVPNTAGHRACRDYLVDTLKPLADSAERQDFTLKLDEKPLQMSNVLARWNGTGGAAGGQNGVLLCAHWDTRPSADQEATAAARRKPIVGANDGASGVAVLLEAARMFKQSPPPVPVMLVLFDGEDYGPEIERMFLGSTYFAEHLPSGTPRRGILLDMVGDRDLRIPQEGYSLEAAKDVVDEVYGVAQRLNLSRHFPMRPGDPIMDDHLPLLAKGLKVIDLIDFDYGPGHAWWHTHADTPDKCSPASLKAVGDVVTEWVYSRR